MGVLGEMVRAGMEGEPIAMKAPLSFSVEPGALRVLVPGGFPQIGRHRHWRSGCTPPEPCVAGYARPWCSIVGVMLLTGRRHPK